MKLFTTMKERVDIYLSKRRHLGFELRVEGGELTNFAKYADKEGHRGPLTTDLVIQWISASKEGSSYSRARKLRIIRCFAKYYQNIEPNTEIPPPGIFGRGYRRTSPYIYSEEEINNLLNATQHLHPLNGLRASTFRVLLGLLLSTGLRISEAIKLTENNVDLTNGLLTICETKFHKSRYVPLHPTTTKSLHEYRLIRKKFVSMAKSNAFFLLDNGLPITVRKAEYDFRYLRQKLGWDKSCKKLPRLYDCRHTFVCRRLIAWYEEGKDIDQVIPLLSTYLGHVKVTDTYWYINGTPSLMNIATKRFEQFAALTNLKENNQ